MPRWYPLPHLLDLRLPVEATAITTTVAATMDLFMRLQIFRTFRVPIQATTTHNRTMELVQLSVLATKPKIRLLQPFLLQIENLRQETAIMSRPSSSNRHLTTARRLQQFGLRMEVKFSRTVALTL